MWLVDTLILLLVLYCVLFYYDYMEEKGDKVRDVVHQFKVLLIKDLSNFITKSCVTFST